MRHRFKIDEDLPAAVAEVFRKSGYDAFTVHEQNMSGASDQELWHWVSSEKRWLLTADKGFADVRSFRPGPDTGIILFRLPRESRHAYLDLAHAMLKGFDFDRAVGATVVVTPDAIRIHRAI